MQLNVCKFINEAQTSASSPWTRHRCSSSVYPDPWWPAGWSHTQSLWSRRHSHGEGPHTGSTQMPLRCCVSRCPSAAPGNHQELLVKAAYLSHFLFCFLWSVCSLWPLNACVKEVSGSSWSRFRAAASSVILAEN